MALRIFSFRPLAAVGRCPSLAPLGAISFEYQQVRGLKPNKHMVPKFKNLRRLKTDIQIPLKYQNDVKKAVEDGMSQSLPTKLRMWKERDLYASTSGQTVDEFNPPENQAEGLTQELKNKWNSVGNFGKDKMALRRIRTFESEFNLKRFVDEAKEIYIKAHECLAANDQEKLTDYVTEYARLTMVLNSSQRTIRWKYLQSLEEPKVVQIRSFHVDENQNTFAQITMRLFSQQCLAIYDRFGRLIYGNEILAKDVLEYVIFEKHLSNEYGTWRLHAKIIPDNLMKMSEQTFAIPPNSSHVPADTLAPENKEETKVTAV